MRNDLINNQRNSKKSSKPPVFGTQYSKRVVIFAATNQHTLSILNKDSDFEITKSDYW